MTAHRPTQTDLHVRLGHKPLNRVWAKVEIFLGLTALGVGVLLGQWALNLTRAEIAWEVVASALALIVFGGYLALAGHRSHLYQSNNELTAYLAAEIHDLKNKGFPNEHLDR